MEILGLEDTGSMGGYRPPMVFTGEKCAWCGELEVMEHEMATCNDHKMCAICQFDLEDAVDARAQQ